MKKHYEKIIKGSEVRIEKALKEQVLDKKNEYYGGFFDEFGLIEAKKAIYHITTMTALYCNKESRFYKNEELAFRINLALDYVASVQHDNGLFDFINCNFLSTPDTAFCTKRLLPAYIYLESHSSSYEKNSAEIVFLDKIKKIIIKAVEGMTHGGFHTPNHRWAISSTLLQCAKLFDRTDFSTAAQPYLNEGIDCNSDGEYSEKSSGNYNRINNDAMITLGDCTGDKSYYEYAVRNLRMMLTYFEVNGSIFTANSTRQDNGVLVYPVDYYTEYLRMGHDFNIPEFLGMANTIFDLIEKNNLDTPDFLMHLMNRPDLIETEYDGRFVQDDFCKWYKESGITRTHTDKFTWTLLQGKSNFLYFSVKNITVEMKVAGSFCEHRAFVPEKINQVQNQKKFNLEQTMRGWYYLPFESKPETSDWWKMDNASRNKLHGPDLNIFVEVEEICDDEGKGVNVHIKTNGVKNAPFRVEIACAGAQKISGHDFAIPAEKGGSLIGKDGMIAFSNSEDCISIGPAFASHSYTAGKFGSEKTSTSCFTLYFTDFVPFDRTIKIRC